MINTEFNFVIIAHISPNHELRIKIYEYVNLTRNVHGLITRKFRDCNYPI